MTNRKNTKKALLTSVISLILCFSMLIGTTFAWFTDSVTSGVNQIVAGNLDVEVYYGDPADENSIEKVDTLFNDVTLWEPGVVAYENLTVVNKGTLALNYNLGINFTNENTVDGYGLSQVLQVAVVEGGVDTKLSREEIVAGISNWQSLSAWYESGALYAEAGKDTATYGIVIWWKPTDSDNNWNVNNGKTTSDGQPLHIDLGVNVTAWQQTHEKDSFGNDYDADLVVMTVAQANARMANGTNEDVVLIGANEPNSVIVIPAGYTGTLTLHNVSVASVQVSAGISTTAEEEETTPKAPKLVIAGSVSVKATEDGMSAISIEGALDISGTGILTAIAKGTHAYGIGGANATAISISGITIDYVAGGCVGGVGSDTKYYKDAPEGGAAIGSGYNGAVITLNGVTINKAIGGSKTAGIGANFWTGVTVNITDSTIGYVEGGVSAAGIGGSRVSSGATSAEAVTITIENSTITAQGGAYGAGIGSGYDTHCQSNQPICTINISGNSVINATGGQYAAGVGTGYHNAGLAGVIEESVTVNAKSGEKVYKTTYTSAQDVGFGVTDPTREGQQTDSYIFCNGEKITIPEVYTSVSSIDDLASALKNGEKVILSGNIENEDSTTYYGSASKLIDMTNGGVLDGNDNTIAAEDEWDDTYDTVIYTKGGTIKNVTIKGAMRGVFSFGLTEDLILDHVTFEDVIYTVNDDASNGHAIKVSNSVLNGWTSWATGHSEVSFTNCEFGWGMGYAFINAHQSVTFTNCDFAEGFQINPAETNAYLTFVNCTYNGELITEENVTDVLYAESDAYLCIVSNN